MEVTAGDPTEDSQIRILATVITTVRIQIDMPPEMAPEGVSVEAVTLEGVDRMEITAEPGAHKGGLVTTRTPPTRMDRDSRVAVKTFGTKLGWCKWILIRGVGKSRSCDTT